MDEALFRMLLELQVSAVGRSILFDVARDLAQLTQASQAFNNAQLLQAQAQLAATRAAQAAADALTAQASATARSSAANAAAAAADVAATRDLANERQVAFNLAAAQAATAEEREARVAASSTASAAQQQLAIAQVEAAQLRESLAAQAVADAHVAQDELVVAADQAWARAAVAAAAETTAAREAEARATVAAAQAEQAAAAVSSAAAAERQQAALGAVTAGAGLVAVAALVTGSFIAVTAEGAAFDQQLIEIQNNTGMTADGFGVMHDAVLKLGEGSGAAFDQLARGFRQANDLSNNSRVAAIELNAAQRDSVATGADVETVTRALAQAMHVYGLDTSTATDAANGFSQAQANASETMAKMQVAANLSNLTLEQFAKNGTLVLAWASSMGVSMDEALAAFGALSKEIPSAARSGTQIIDMFSRIINPSKEAYAELQRISVLSGVNLVSDFNATALSTKGLTGVVNDMRLAFHNMGLTTAEQDAEVLKLIPNLRGGAGAFILLNNAAKDYSLILNSVRDTQSAVAGQDAAYERATTSLAGQWRIFTQDLHGAAIELGEGFEPAAARVLGRLGPLATGFADWAVANRELIATAAPVAAGITAIAGAALLLGGAVTLVGLLSPLGAAIAGITVVVGALGLAWATNFWDVRDVPTHVTQHIQQLKDTAAELAVSFERLAAKGDSWVGLATSSVGLTGVAAVGFKSAAGGADDWAKALGGVAQNITVVDSNMSALADGLIQSTALEGAMGAQAETLAGQINAMGSAAQSVANLFGGLGALTDMWVNQTAAVQGANAGLAAAENHLNAVRDAEAAASGAGNGMSRVLRDLERQSTALSTELSKAQKALQDLAHPNLPGMEAADSKIFRMEQALKRLEDRKLTMEIGGVSGHALDSIDKLIKRQQEMIELAKNHESLKYDDQLRKIAAAVEGTKQVMTFAQAMEQVKTLKGHISEWTAEQDSLKKRIQETQDAISAGSGVRSGYSQQARDAEQAVRDWKEEQKNVTATLKETATWTDTTSKQVQSYGGVAAQAGAEVDAMAQRINTDVMVAAASGLPPAAIAEIAAADQALFKQLLAKYADLFSHGGQQTQDPFGPGPVGRPGSLEGPSSRASQGLRGFASGGSFTVPGAGGVDSSLVQFMATPGERVSVGGGGGGVNVYVTVSENAVSISGGNAADRRVAEDATRVIVAGFKRMEGDFRSLNFSKKLSPGGG